MNTAPALRRRLLAFAIVVSPLVGLACSQSANHPALIGDCSGANCPPGQGQAVPSGNGTGTDGAVADGSGGDAAVTDSGGGTDAPTD